MRAIFFKTKPHLHTARGEMNLVLKLQNSNTAASENSFFNLTRERQLPGFHEKKEKPRNFLNRGDIVYTCHLPKLTH